MHAPCIHTLACPPSLRALPVSLLVVSSKPDCLAEWRRWVSRSLGGQVEAPEEWEDKAFKEEWAKEDTQEGATGGGQQKAKASTNPSACLPGDSYRQKAFP